MSGIFYCGDNLEILTTLDLVPAESVDLVYLDPPFNSKRTYNITYKDSRAQAQAFKDHWSWEEAAPQYSRLLDAPETPAKLKTLLRGLHDLLIDDAGDLLAYITMMAPRVFALHRVLKPTGSLYLHCDGTASHYLKLVLDATFGVRGFANHISWKRTTAHNDAKRFGRITDHILFYTKSAKKTFNRAPGGEYSPEQLARYRFTAPDGRKYKCENLTAPHFSKTRTVEWRGTHPGANRQWRFGTDELERLWSEGRIATKADGKTPKKDGLIEYLDEAPGPVLQDIWTDIVLPPTPDERVGFDTQKPVELLARIIASSSNVGDLVLDPFCGCGTTIETCERLGRRWIGIDIAVKAVEITEERFEKLGRPAPEIEWYPPDIDAAKALAARSGLKFEAWVRRKIRAARRRKHDRGIDGEAYFRDAQNHLTHVLVSVKGGKLNPAMVRELRGTMEREHAPIGVLVVAQEPSKEMRLEATHAGFLKESDAEGPIPRLQFVTLDRIFSDMPAIRAPGVNVTEMPKPVVPTEVPEQLALRLEPPKPPKKATKGSEEKARPAAEEAPASSRKSGRPGR